MREQEMFSVERFRRVNLDTLEIEFLSMDYYQGHGRNAALIQPTTARLGTHLQHDPSAQRPWISTART